MAKTDFKSVDEYIATLPGAAQVTLQKVRQALRKALPDGEEAISYQIPVIRFHGPIFHFAAWKQHYSLYPVTASLLEAFPELAPHAGSKGTLKFSYDEPVPVRLLALMAKHKASENLQAETAKRKK